MPQIHPLSVGFFGEKKKLCVVSPNPVLESTPSATESM
jgi:hypothetical protein